MSPRDAPAAPTPSPSLLRRIAGSRLAVAFLLAAAALGLLWQAQGGVRVTRDLVSGAREREAAGADRRLGCLAERVEQLVPPGSRVHVDAGIGLELSERVTELVWLRDAVPVADDRSADVVLTARTDPAGGACEGVDLLRAR